jgi:hypothetical protein
MTKDERHGFGWIVQDRSRGLPRAGDHDNWQAETPRRENFGERRLAAAILANDDIDRFLAQKLFLRFNREGAAPMDDAMARQVWQRRERLNRANKIEMLGRRRKGLYLQAADRQEDAPRFAPERGGGGGHIGYVNPTIARLPHPRRARQNDKWNLRPTCSDRRMARNLSGERMRGIDEDVDALGFEIGVKAIHAAKAADPIGNFWRAERIGTASERQHGRNIGPLRKEIRKLARLERTTKHENPHRPFPKFLSLP